MHEPPIALMTLDAPGFREALRQEHRVELMGLAMDDPVVSAMHPGLEVAGPLRVEHQFPGGRHMAEIVLGVPFIPDRIDAQARQIPACNRGVMTRQKIFVCDE